MVVNPELGGRYWIVTDFWERFYSVPVTIVAASDEHGAFLGRLEMGCETAECFEGLFCNELYATEAEARAAIREKEAPPFQGVGKTVNYLEE